MSRAPKFRAVVGLLLVGTATVGAAPHPSGPKAIGVGQAGHRPSVVVSPSRWAVVIGINDYDDPAIPDLHYAENDARAVRSVLVHPGYGAFPKQRVRLLLGKADPALGAERATARNIRGALNWLVTHTGKNDLVVLYYSGHGAPEHRYYYWISVDAQMRDLDSTAVPNYFIQRKLRDITSERVVSFIDCCEGAGTVPDLRVALGVRPRGVGVASRFVENFKGKGRVTITASDEGQQSLELAEFQQGLFTYYLVKALQGDADTAGGSADGFITLEEVWTYLRASVMRKSRERKGNQVPVMHAEGTTPRFLLSLNPAVKAQQEKRVKVLMRMLADGTLTGEEYDEAKRLLSELPLNEYESKLRHYYQRLADGDLPADLFRDLRKTLRKARADAEQAPARQRPTVPAPVAAQPARPATPAAAPVAAPVPTVPLPPAVSPAQPATSPPPPVVPPTPPKPLWDRLVEQMPELSTFRPVPGAGVDRATGLPLKLLCLTDRMPLVLIPPGPFRMGADDIGGDERPVHVVTLSPYYIDQHEVTNAQFASFFAGHGHGDEDEDGWREHASGKPRHPVRGVTWDQASAYAHRVGRRLPTEAQWEKAARGPQQTPWPWGTTFQKSAAYIDRGGLFGPDKPESVASFPACGYGLHDMAGNVREWCRDRHWGSYYGKSPAKDPVNLTDGGHRVVRGGAWNQSRDYGRTARREHAPTDAADDNTGFRCVLEIPPQSIVH